MLADKPGQVAPEQRGIAELAAAGRRSSYQSGGAGAISDHLGVASERQAALVARGGKAWWVLAAVSALLLIGLTAAAVYLLTKKRSTVDQVVILTVPSGAEIRLDSNDYGHSP